MLCAKSVVREEERIMSNSRKLGRAPTVATGGTSIPPGQSELSGSRTGDIPSPATQLPIRPPQPQSAASAGGPADLGGELRSSSVASERGSTQPKGKCPGKVRRPGRYPKKAGLRVVPLRSAPCPPSTLQGCCNQRTDVLYMVQLTRPSPASWVRPRRSMTVMCWVSSLGLHPPTP